MVCSWRLAGGAPVAVRIPNGRPQPCTHPKQSVMPTLHIHEDPFIFYRGHILPFMLFP